jgi:sulfotransferase family protein
MADISSDQTAVAPEAKPAMTGILWLASYPKSGNTWTRNFLHNLLNILEGAGDNPQNINGMNEFTAWEISARFYESHLGEPTRECTREEIATARPKVQQDIADGLAMIKTHHALVVDRSVPVINTTVTSGVVYIVCNPLDVGISFAHRMRADTDTAIEEMAFENLETGVSENSVYEVYGSWSQHVGSWTRQTHRAIYVMRYENMLADPFRIFGGLARHLLLRPTDDQLRLANERSSFEVLKSQEEEAGFKEKPEKAKCFFRK